MMTTNSLVQKVNNPSAHIRLILPVLLVCAVTTTSLAQKGKHDHKEEVALANGFLNAIKSKNYEDLRKFFPTVAAFRITAPDETEGKTDAEVLEIAKPLSDGLRDGYQLLLQEADSLKVDVKKLTFIKQTMSAIPMTNGSFFVQEIFFSYGKKKGSFTIGTAYIDKWYIYAIERMVGVFKEMK
jgi:hypothetical protein